MFRNQYDTDVTVWSPEGRLLQVSRATVLIHEVMLLAGVARYLFYWFSEHCLLVMAVIYLYHYPIKNSRLFFFRYRYLSTTHCLIITVR